MAHETGHLVANRRLYKCKGDFSGLFTYQNRETAPNMQEWLANACSYDRRWLSAAIVELDDTLPTTPCGGLAALFICNSFAEDGHWNFVEVSLYISGDHKVQ